MMITTAIIVTQNTVRAIFINLISNSDINNYDNNNDNDNNKIRRVLFQLFQQNASNLHDPCMCTNPNDLRCQSCNLPQPPPPPPPSQQPGVPTKSIEGRSSRKEAAIRQGSLLGCLFFRLQDGLKLLALLDTVAIFVVEKYAICYFGCLVTISTLSEELLL